MFAGYEQEDGSVIGDPVSKEFTTVIISTLHCTLQRERLHEKASVGSGRL